MNLALGALIITLFLLPAYSFRIGLSSFLLRRSNSGTDTGAISRNISKALSDLNFTETVFLFSIVPLCLHLASIIVLHSCGCNIQYQLLLNILSGKPDVLAQNSNEIFHHELAGFLFYILIETAIAVFAGALLISFVGDQNWLLQLLVGNNIWYKLFAGSSLTAKQKKQLSGVLVEILAETKEASIIYSGFLKNYELTDSGDLAYILLTGVYRRDLRSQQLTRKEIGQDAEATSSHYDSAYGDIIHIPGQSFMIPGKEIMNVNVTYMKRVTDANTSQVRLVPID